MERNSEKEPSDGIDELLRKNAESRGKLTRLQEELHRIKRERSILNQIAAIFLTAPDEEIYGNVLKVILEATESEFGIFGFIAENGDLVVPSLTSDIWDKCQVPDKSIVFPVPTWGNSVWGRAIKERRSINSEGPFRVPSGHVPLGNCLAVPILYGNKAIGLLAVANRQPGYTEDEKVLVEGIAASISPILKARLQRDRQEKERSLAEEALHKREQAFRALLENSPDFIARFDPDGRILYCNRITEEAAGAALEDLYGKTLMEAFPEFGGVHTVHDSIKEVVKTGSAVRTEIIIHTPHAQTPPYYQVSLVPERDSTDRVVSVLGIGRDISALKETERQLSTLVENFPDAIVRFDGECRYLYVSPNARKVVGEPREDFVGRTVDEIYPGTVSGDKSLSDLIREVFEQGESNTCAAVRSLPDGERVFDLRHIPEFDQSGRVKTVLGICRDVTEQRKAEKDNLAHLRFYESMDRINRAIQGTDNIEQMMSDVLDALLSIFECDRAWLFYPADPDAETWRVPMERTRPEYPGALALGTDLEMSPHMAEVIRAVRDSDNPVKFGPGGDRPLPPDFSVRFDYQSFIATALYPKTGKPWMFGLHQCSYAREWTPAEARLFEAIGRRLTDGLTSLLVYHDVQTSERRQRFALQLGKIGVFEADLESRRGTWTAEIERIWGMPVDTDDVLTFCREHVHPEDLPMVRRVYEEVLQSREEREMEFRIVRSEGTIRWIRWRGQVVQDAGGRHSRIICVNMDVTEGKEVEDERRRLEARLFQSQKIESIGTLTGGIAHDFNNILSALMGYAALLQMKMEEKDPLRSFVDEIVSGSQKAAELTRSLLAFSRQQPITFFTLGVKDIVTGIEKLLRRLVTEDVAIKTILAADQPVIRADATQIEQVLLNLATNARDAMPNGGSLLIETRITELDETFVRSHGYGEPGRYALIAVSDTGVGMDEATRQRAFDPFFTTKEVGKGTGLGLSTVYGIVKQHNGYITVYSEPNIGTTFHVYLPIEHRIVPREKQTAAAAKEVRGGTEVILVAEDNQAVRNLMKDVLTQYGYTIIEAVDGADAVDKFKKADHVDLLILDSVMPKRNGRETYNEIHSLTPDVRVLFISGYTRDVILNKGIEDNRFPFLSKPIQAIALLNKVREVLDQ